jgi:hypothetical protein
MGRPVWVIAKRGGCASLLNRRKMRQIEFPVHVSGDKIRQTVLEVGIDPEHDPASVPPPSGQALRAT